MDNNKQTKEHYRDDQPDHMFKWRLARPFVSDLLNYLSSDIDYASLNAL